MRRKFTKCSLFLRDAQNRHGAEDQSYARQGVGADRLAVGDQSHQRAEDQLQGGNNGGPARFEEAQTVGIEHEGGKASDEAVQCHGHKQRRLGRCCGEDLAGVGEEQAAQGAEGEGIEVVSDLNDGGKALISFIAVEENQSMDELPDTDSSKYEMMISGSAAQGATLEPGEYDLKITVQGKATGTVTLNVTPVENITGM